METFPLERYRCFRLLCFISKASALSTKEISFLVDPGAGMGFISEATLNSLGYKITDDLPVAKTVLATGIEVMTPIITIPSLIMVGREFSFVQFRTLKGSTGISLLGVDILSCFRFTYGYDLVNSVFEIEPIEGVNPEYKPPTVQNIYGTHVFS